MSLSKIVLAGSAALGAGIAVSYAGLDTPAVADSLGNAVGRTDFGVISELGAYVANHGMYASAIVAALGIGAYALKKFQ